MRERPDAEAWCATIRPRLVGALSLYTGDPQVAEDVAQEALARVWDRWERVRTMRSPEAWTFTVAFNLAHSWFRRVRSRRDRERRAATQAALLDAIDSEQQRSGLGVLLITHDAILARHWCRKVLDWHTDVSHPSAGSYSDPSATEPSASKLHSG